MINVRQKKRPPRHSATCLFHHRRARPLELGRPVSQTVQERILWAMAHLLSLSQRNAPTGACWSSWPQRSMKSHLPSHLHLLRTRRRAWRAATLAEGHARAVDDRAPPQSDRMRSPPPPPPPPASAVQQYCTSPQSPVGGALGQEPTVAAARWRRARCARTRGVTLWRDAGATRAQRPASVERSRATRTCGQ